MFFDEKLKEYIGKSREELIHCEKTALARIVIAAVDNNIDKGTAAMATLGFYLLFSKTDGSADYAEMDLFNSFTEMKVDAATYAQLTQTVALKQCVDEVLSAAITIMEADPSVKDAFADIAMIAIVANGEVTDTEKEYFITLFDR